MTSASALLASPSKAYMNRQNVAVRDVQRMTAEAEANAVAIAASLVAAL